MLWWDGARVVEREPRLDPLLAEAEQRVRAHPPAESARCARCTSGSGIDPTKTRPSNEALLRRVRKGQPLPRVNSLVDVINWCSVEFQLPYGLYDRRQIRGAGHAAARAATARSTPAFARTPSTSPDGSRWSTTRARSAIPTSDSARTMVTTATTDALVVVFAPVDVDAARLTRVLDTTAARMADIAGGREAARLICA